MPESLQPLISVVIPLFNKRNFIERAIISVQAQTLQNWELIVVDDGSTDDSPAVVAALLARQPDPRIRIVSQSNQGPGAARNHGLRLALAPLVAFLDADDAWDPGFLADGHTALSSTWPAAACWTSGYYEFPGGKSTEPSWRARGLEEGCFQVHPAHSRLLFTHQLAYMSPCTTLARRDLLVRHGGFYSRNRCRYGEDAYLWLLILLHHPVAFSLSPRVRIHRDAAQLSNNLGTARPLEPFLEDPAELRASCPATLRPLLEDFLTLRAFKTACVWGYWGKWRQAAALRRRFRRHQDWRLPRFLASLICITPVGAALGWLHRQFTR